MNELFESVDNLFDSDSFNLKENDSKVVKEEDDQEYFSRQLASLLEEVSDLSKEAFHSGKSKLYRSLERIYMELEAIPDDYLLESKTATSLKEESEVKFTPGDWSDVNMTGYLTKFDGDIKPSELTKVLGKSLGPSLDDKSKYNWVVKFQGNYYSVYDYKGDRWHVGGFRDTDPDGFVRALLSKLGR